MSNRFSCILIVSLISTGIFSQETKLVREPSVSEKSIAFSYANDLWIVDRDGGLAQRLTSSIGAEGNPHFSPDGSLIAFNANYTGNSEVYIVSSTGGEPRRITCHPYPDIACGWTPDGKKVLIGSSRKSAPIQVPQLWTLPVEGGLPEFLPIPSAARASYSASGKLLAYEDIRWQSEWKWYRGGQAKPIMLVSFPDLEQTAVPGPVSVNMYPVFLGETLYFLSDRDGIFNIYEYNPVSGNVRQITYKKDSDIKSLAAWGDILVYEHNGSLHILSLLNGTDKELTITVHGDFPQAMSRWKDVKGEIAAASLSPNGVRALFEARGEIFTVPAEKGNVRNLTNSSGSAERSPAWSPDGSKIAWFSDKSGEYQLIIADQKGLESPKVISLGDPTFYLQMAWSPDSKKLAFADAGWNLWLVDVEKSTALRFDTDRRTGVERSMYPVWSPDSRWIAYSKQLPNMFRAIMIYSLYENKSYQMTDGFSDAVSPDWDKSGKYLFFLASTDVGLNTGWLDLSSLERPMRRGVYFAVLAKETPSPLLPESDDEKVQKEDESEQEKTKDKEKGKNKQTAKGKEKESKETGDSLDVKIDFESITNRILSLPMPMRYYTGLTCGPEGIVFITENGLPFYEGLGSSGGATIHKYDLKEKEDKTFLSGATSFTVSANRSKVLYRKGGDWFIGGTEQATESGEGKLNVELVMNIDPASEWKQIYREAWRFDRDFFYVPNHHGADWNAVYEKYIGLIPYVRHREDLNYIIDMMGGELGVGHHFVGGGDIARIESTPIGLLGADITFENGFYRLRKIFSGENWNPDLRSPLSAPGINVKEGDYIIAINGAKLIPPATPESALEGLADKQVIISVNSEPSAEGAHDITVIPVGWESGLRSRAWIEDNRRLVDRLSNGKLAYVWLPNTAEAGYTYFNRYYFGQQDRNGAILDERFNGGGFVADYIIDIVARKLRGYFNNPVGTREPWTEPFAGIWGPKVMVINEFAGSGGDMLPYMFSQQELGPLVGTRTWGGLVGIWDFPSLIDGGGITVPRGGFFNLQGEWDVENKGIKPDIEVMITPKDIASGHDPQLERAVSEALRLLKENPVNLLKEPPFPVREP